VRASAFSPPTYQRIPPWDIGRPQSAIVRLDEAELVKVEGR
jgi:hypothetical protein